MDLIIAQNDRTAEALTAAAVKCHVEPNVALDAPGDEVLAGTADTRHLRLIVVGRLIPLKRVALALRTLADPSLRGATLTIVGDGPQRDGLVELAKRLGVGERIQFTGTVSRNRAIELMRASDVLVHPSCSEGAPWVVGEALNEGVPAVAFEGSGADTLIRLSGGHGAVVPSSVPPVAGLVAAIQACHDLSSAGASRGRWSRGRLPDLVKSWYLAEVETACGTPT